MWTHASVQYKIQEATQQQQEDIFLVQRVQELTMYVTNVGFYVW